MGEEEQIARALAEKKRKQTEDLMDLLGDEDDTPQLKVDRSSANLDPNQQVDQLLAPWLDESGTGAVNPNVGVVKVPSFLKGTDPAADAGMMPQATPEVYQAPEAPIDPEAATGELWHDLGIFFTQLGRAYTARYELWERTINTILSILRKMQQNMTTNTDTLLANIEDLHDKIKKGLEQYAQKRDEVEKFSDVDYKYVIKLFKKTIELLNFQVREFRLQQTIQELAEIYIR
jgi:hypothetical protein